MIDFIYSFLKQYGLAALFISSFGSNFLLFPAFVEFSCLVFLTLGFTPIPIFLSLISGSFLGGVLSYYFGFLSSHTLLRYEKKIKDIQKLIEKYGSFSVFMVSFLPIPFPFALFAMLAGFLKMNFKHFSIFMIMGKSLRIALALFVFTWGIEILKFYGLI